MPARQFAVSNKFTAKEGVSKAFGKMEKGAGRFGRKATKSFRQASRSASRFQDITKSLLAVGAVNRAIGALTSGVRSITEQFIQFDDAIVGATVRFKDIGPDAADFTQQLEKLKKTAREAGSTTEFTSAQAAKGLDFLARAGFTSTEAIGSLNAMINLATATGEDFSSVADMSSDLLGAFGLAVDDSAQKIKNLNRLNDVLVKSANSANVTVEDMFETMKDAAPVAAKLGIDLEEVAAATAFLGGAGIKGSKGATALKTAFLNLSALPKKTADALKEINVTVDDGTGNMKKFSTIMGEIRTELKGVGTLKTARILDAIFGKRAIAGAANITEGVDAIEKFEKSLRNADGVAERTAEILRKSLGNRLKSLGSAATEFGFKFLEAFEVNGKSGIDALTEAIRGFDPTPVIEGLKIAVKLVRALFRVMEPFLPILPVLIGGLLAYSLALKGLAIAQAIIGFVKFLFVLKSMVGVWGILNAVMIANPIGAVIFAITALVALMVLLEKKFGIMTFIWEKIQSLNPFSHIVEGIKFLFPMLSKLEKKFGILAKLWERIKAAGKTVASFLGFGDEEEVAEKRTAPNKEEIEARQQIAFKGRLDIAGAPEGSTLKTETVGAPPIDAALLGVNP